MRETNFSAHAIDSMRRFCELNSSKGFHVESPVTKIMHDMRYVSSRLMHAQKFRVPENGMVLDWPNSEIITRAEKFCIPLGMPYPITAFEYVDVSGVPIVILCVQNEESSSSYLLRILLEDTSRGWFPHPLNIFLGGDESTFTMSHGRAYHLNSTMDDGKVSGEICGKVLMFMAALRCKNVHTSELHPSQRLNAKRSRSGKCPFFTYKILEISGKDESPRDGSGSHASPRVHLRRGHIRAHRSAGNIWVNACVVGDKTIGMVSKEYLILPQHETMQ